MKKQHTKSGPSNPFQPVFSFFTNFHVSFSSFRPKRDCHVKFTSCST